MAAGGALRRSGSSMDTREQGLLEEASTSTLGRSPRGTPRSPRHGRLRLLALAGVACLHFALLAYMLGAVVLPRVPAGLPAAPAPAAARYGYAAEARAPGDDAGSATTGSVAVGVGGGRGGDVLDAAAGGTATTAPTEAPAAAAALDPASPLVRTIQAMQASGSGYAAFKHATPAAVVAALDAALASEAGLAGPSKFMGLAAAEFCKLAALRRGAGGGTRSGRTEFAAPLAAPVLPGDARGGVVLTTFFNSRVDPLRCWKHAGGTLGESFDYIAVWYWSVRKLGVPAVVFHEGLSDEFVAKYATDRIAFQRVALAHPHWSVVDERWAVYADWLASPAAENVKWVLSTDVSDAHLAERLNVFDFFEASRREGGWDLWVNTQKDSEWVRDNYGECYGPEAAASAPDLAPFPLGAKSVVYNAGVVGGTRAAFAQLASEIVAEFAVTLDAAAAAGRPVWNCDMGALQRVLLRPGVEAAAAAAAAGGAPAAPARKVWARGHPFCAGEIKCVKRGLCDYYVWHKK